MTSETAAKLIDISLKQADDEVQHWVVVQTQAEEQRTRAKEEAARATALADLERAERAAKNTAALAAMAAEQRAAILASISFCLEAGNQKNTPQFNECVLDALKAKVQASLESDARRAAIFQLGLGMMSNSHLPPGMAAGRAASPGQFQDPPPMQLSPPRLCSSYVNGQYKRRAAGEMHVPAGRGCGGLGQRNGNQGCEPPRRAY